MEPVGRNRPCPCGSGKRYKECHGLVHSAPQGLTQAASRETSTQGLLQEASRALDAGDVDAAETLARLVLAANREQSDALCVLGQCECRRGRPEEAVRLLLAAAHLIEGSAVSKDKQYEVWTELNFALKLAVYSADRAFAAATRAEHARWLGSLPRLQRDAAPLVSIVILAGDDSSRLRSTLASVYAQTYRQLEIVIVDACADPASSQRIAGLLVGCPLPHELVAHPPAEESILLNAGVGASSGQFVNAISPNDEFDAERVRTFVEQVANRDGAWGFGDVEFVANNPLDAKGQARVQSWRELIDGVLDLDTVGYAFIQPDCVAVTTANVFFSRDLFDRLGGFRKLPHTYLWDFCLRALWLEEPRFVASRLLRHRPALTALRRKRTEFEAAQVMMFREFYEKACDEQAVAPNRYAPCVHHWGAHFLTAPFHSGHVLILGLQRIERIAASLQRGSTTRQPRSLDDGINLVGLAFGELGIGENLRAIARACAAGGIPFMVKNVRQPLNTREADDSVKQYVADEPRYRCSLYCVNPDLMPSVHGLMADSAAAGGYGIGYWYWELDRLPLDWSDALTRVDEIWVASEFVATAVRGVTSKPVRKIPPPIEVLLSRRYARSDFALREDRFLFLFSFDYNSFPKRKNPDGAIAAFRRAFGDRRDVGLVLKSVNGRRYPERFAETRELVGSDERIVMLDGFLTRDETSGLQSVADAFVSLHRSEGLGLGLAESMYQGKPVIGTRYSGNLEFMNDENSCLVDYELVPVERGDYAYHGEGWHWAEPDMDQAAQLMRRLVDEAGFRHRIGRAGQETIRTRFTRTATAAMIRERLGTLGLI
jgi:glycosyltransferase involved in cell wall biosynthesis